MDVSNASVYEGPSALAAAGLPREADERAPAFRRSRAACTRTRARRCARSRPATARRSRRSPLRDGVTDAAAWAAAIDDDVGAVFVAQPNFLGAVEDLAPLIAAAREHGALVVCSADPLVARHPRGAGRARRRRLRRRGPDARQPPRLRRPVVRLLRGARGAPAADAGADRRRDRRRRRPPRLRADAADARAAHPPREGDLEHLHGAGAERARRRRLPLVAGPARPRRAGRAARAAHRLRARRAARDRRRQRAAHAAGRARVRGLARACPTSRRAARDRALRAPSASTRATRSGATIPSYADGLLVAITEQRSRADIDRLADVLGRALAAERAARRHRGGRMSAATRRRCSATARDDLREGRAGPPRVRAAAAGRSRAPARRADPGARCAAASRPRLPEVSEPELVRHYVRLSRRNFDLDSGFYPLGSCTMKHNPRLHERVAALPGHARLHPLTEPARAQGALELMWRLERALGRDRRPAARLAAALGRLARRARRRAADARLPRRPRRAAPHGADARHRARHQPRDRDDGRLRGRQGRHRRSAAASTSTTCARRPTATSPA